MSKPKSTRIAFVCVQNAGRSQMAHAFAKREREERDLQNQIELITGGTNPAEEVHPEVIDVMADVGIDLSGRIPREITPEELQESDYVITMGCSADAICPARWSGNNRDWDLPDPHEMPINEVAEIRDEIQFRIGKLFEEIV